MKESENEKNVNLVCQVKRICQMKRSGTLILKFSPQFLNSKKVDFGKIPETSP